MSFDWFESLKICNVWRDLLQCSQLFNQKNKSVKASARWECVSLIKGK